jgi:predicted nicotinamide N-methyase
MGDYCHFNSGKESVSSFNIDLFGVDITLYQNPSSRAVGHGAVVWDAAVIFSKYMEVNPSDFEPTKLSGKTVLELGSGCGLAGLALMLRGAHVTFTDLEAVVNMLTIRNVQTMHRLFRSEESIKYPIQEPEIRAIDWTVEAKLEDENPKTYDIILLTDCVFSMDLIDDLIGTILHHSGPKTTLICCHEIRDEVANDAFVERISQYFKIKRIPKNKLHPQYCNEFVELFTGRMQKKKNGP